VITVHSEVSADQVPVTAADNLSPQLETQPNGTVLAVLTFLTMFFTCNFSQSLSLHSHLSLTQADLLEFDHSVFDSHWWW